MIAQVINLIHQAAIQTLQVVDLTHQVADLPNQVDLTVPVDLINQLFNFLNP